MSPDLVLSGSGHRAGPDSGPSGERAWVAQVVILLVLALGLGLLRVGWMHAWNGLRVPGSGSDPAIPVAVADASAPLGAGPDAAMPSIAWPDAQRAARSPAGVLWVDARPTAAFAAGHVPQALSCPVAAADQAVELVLPRWSPERLVVVYCSDADCDASRLVAAQLRQDLGGGRIRILTDGWDGYVRSGLPQAHGAEDAP